MKNDVVFETDSTILKYELNDVLRDMKITKRSFKLLTYILIEQNLFH